jgi:hypothetical protein
MKQYMITESSGGFGDWDSGERFEVNEGELDDLMSQMDILELGKDELPEGVEDIRGRIHDQTGRIFTLITGRFEMDIMGNESDIPEVEYFGIED